MPPWGSDDGGRGYRRGKWFGQREDSVMFVEGSSKAPAIRFDVPAFTLVAATTHPGKISSPVRDRFKVVGHLEPYDADDLALVLAGASRGTPRRAVRLVDAARDYSFEVTGQLDELIDPETARQSLEYNDIDEHGLEQRDRRYLKCWAREYMGGPVGAPVPAGRLGMDLSELTNDVEPFLMTSGCCPGGRTVAAPRLLRTACSGCRCRRSSTDGCGARYDQLRAVGQACEQLDAEIVDESEPRDCPETRRCTPPPAAPPTLGSVHDR